MKETIHLCPAMKERPKTQYLIMALALVASIICYVITRDLVKSAATFVIVGVVVCLSAFIGKKIQKSNEIKKMEEVFPDFIELMASNLRAGATIDRALLMSSRKEFAPLDKEITFLGKEIITGKEITAALANLSLRINSEKIKKTTDLIISGIRSGGNISVLLEETAINMRERSFIEKKAASNVLMYVIFIFFAVAIGAPILFGLSSALVQIMTNIISTIPVTEMPAEAPFTLTEITVSVGFITYLSVIFLSVTALLASLMIGLVSKGDEKSGLGYFFPLAIASVTIFFVIKTFMIKYFAGFFV